MRVPSSQRGTARTWAGTSNAESGATAATSVRKENPGTVQIPPCPPTGGSAASPEPSCSGSPEGARFSSFNETLQALTPDRRVPGPMGRQHQVASSPPLRAWRSRRHSPAWGASLLHPKLSRGSPGWTARPWLALDSRWAPCSPWPHRPAALYILSLPVHLANPSSCNGHETNSRELLNT